MKALLKTLRYVRSPGLLRREIDVLRDYLSFKQRYGFLKERIPLSDPTKKVLIVSLTDWIAQVKMEAMLAKALQLRGYTPILVTHSSSRQAAKYFQAFGYDQFVFFDQMTESISDGAMDEETDLLLNGKLSFSSLLDFRYREVNVGRHVLSTLLRSLRNWGVEFSNPQVKAKLRQWLPQAIRSALAAESLLDQVKPQIALFLEKGYLYSGEIFDVAVNRGINTIQFLHSHRSDALVLKRYHRENRDLHPFSLSPESWEQAKQMPWTEVRERELMQELEGRYKEGTWFDRKYLHVGKKLKSAEEIQKQLGLDPHKKTAVIFSHVLWDATFFYGKNLFDDYEEWLVETVKAACANPAVNWVIKLHPDYVWKLKQTGDLSKPREPLALEMGIGKLPRHIKILEPDTDISTFSLFDVTDYCLTVRGTIGLEMPCFGIPVFTAGTGRYSGLGFTSDSSSREDYLAKIRRIQNFPRLSPDEILSAKKHAYALLKLRPCAFQTFEMVQRPLDKLGHPLDHNVVIRARSFREVAEAPDLNDFAAWCVDSEAVDFLR